MEDYIQRFEELSAQADSVTNNQGVQFFVSGLKQYIAIDVKIKRPPDIDSVMHLARLYEQRAEALNPQPRRTTQASRNTQFVKRLSRSGLEKRRARGLCFNCDETYAPGHCCKKLFLLEGIEDTSPVITDVDEAEDHGDMEISIRAITGTHSAKTMHVLGYIAHSPLKNTH